MNQHDWNYRQIDEALSADNKYYYWLAHGKAHDNYEQLLEYYVASGGAVNFATRNKPTVDKCVSCQKRGTDSCEFKAFRDYEWKHHGNRPPVPECRFYKPS